MMKLLLLLLVALPDLAGACAHGYDTWLDGRCFHLDPNPTTYSHAHDKCAQDGTRLVSIKSAEESGMLFSALAQRGPGAYSASLWLGLACDGKTFVWADGTEAKYTNFADDYKCTLQSTNHHYFIGSDRRWYEMDEQLFPNSYICEAEARSASACDSYKLVDAEAASKTCYELSSTARTWTEAENNCQIDGGYLSVVHDQTLNNFIRRTAVGNDLLSGVHIGMRNDGNYSWVDDSAIDYENFAQGFPNDVFGTCVAMQTSSLNGQWTNEDCFNTKLPYVCTRPAFYPTDPQPAGCPVKNQYAPGDDIFSPSFPLAPDNLQCDYHLLDPTPNKRAQVEITFLEANTCCDWLTVYDGKIGGTILAKLTGYNPAPLRIRASSNAIVLHWVSTSGAHVRGFHAKMLTV